MRISTLTVAIVSIFLLFNAASAATTLIRLGDGHGDSETRATGVNNANQVTGYSTSNTSGLMTNHALIWLDKSNDIAEFSPFMGVGATNYARFNSSTRTKYFSTN
jgi:hypothetical protein